MGDIRWHHVEGEERNGGFTMAVCHQQRKHAVENGVGGHTFKLRNSLLRPQNVLHWQLALQQTSWLSTWEAQQGKIGRVLGSCLVLFACMLQEPFKFLVLTTYPTTLEDSFELFAQNGFFCQKPCIVVVQLCIPLQVQLCVPLQIL
jgi:hypothetical protein